MKRGGLMLFRLIVFILTSITPFSLSAEAGTDKLIVFSGTHIQQKYKKEMTVKELESYFDLIEVKTYDPWEQVEERYTGILITDLVAKFSQNKSSQLSFFAVDRYNVVLDKSEWTEYQIILVTRKGGDYQSVSDKGPLRIIYNKYNSRDLEQRLALSNWIWMIKRIELN